MHDQPAAGPAVTDSREGTSVSFKDILLLLKETVIAKALSMGSKTEARQGLGAVDKQYRKHQYRQHALKHRLESSKPIYITLLNQGLVRPWSAWFKALTQREAPGT